jgi:hypothetical protein
MGESLGIHGILQGALAAVGGAPKYKVGLRSAGGRLPNPATLVKLQSMRGAYSQPALVRQCAHPILNHYPCFSQSVGSLPDHPALLCRPKAPPGRARSAKTSPEDASSPSSSGMDKLPWFCQACSERPRGFVQPVRQNPAAGQGAFG